MNVWKIYYDHWSKENNEKVRKRYREKCVLQTLLILKAWLNGTIIKKNVRITNIEWFQRELLYDLESPILQINEQEDDESRLEDQMMTLKQMGEALCPRLISCSTNDEMMFFEVRNSQLERNNRTPPYCISPSEKRFLKNCDMRRSIQFMHMEFDGDNLRRLDALLALF